MSDEVQPGVRIDEDLWEEFKKTVEEQHGRVYGNLRRELENAIKEYIRSDETPTDRKILKRLQRIESHVAAGATDGEGPPTPTSSEAENTHTHREPENISVDEKPSAKSSRDKKVAWLAQRAQEELSNISVTNESQPVPEKKLREIVESEYSFREDTIDEYVMALREHFGLEYETPQSRLPNQTTMVCSVTRKLKILRGLKDDLEENPHLVPDGFTLNDLKQDIRECDDIRMQDVFDVQ